MTDAPGDRVARVYGRPLRSARLAVIALAVSLVASAAHASGAGPPCAEDVAAWVAECAQREGLTLRDIRCPAGRFVMGVEPELEIEIVYAAPEAFRKVGDHGLSPVGSFSDWAAEPQARREALEGVERCVARAPPPRPIAAPAAPPEQRAQPSRRSLPLARWLLGAVLLAAALALRRRWPAETAAPPAERPRRLELWTLATIATLAFAVRAPGLSSLPLDNDEPVTLDIQGLSAWAASQDARLHPPLMAIVAGALAEIAPGLVALRAVSLVAGVATVIMVWIAARRVSPAAAALAALFLALAPSAVHVSQLARGYALLACLLMGAHSALWLALRRDHAGAWVAYAGLAALAGACEYAAVAPLLVEVAVAAIVVRRSPRRAMALAGAALAVLVALSSLWPFVMRDPTRLVGHEPRPPTGGAQAVLALSGAYGGELGPLAFALALLGLFAIGSPRLLRAPGLALGEHAARLAAAASIVLALAWLARFTSVRPRYALHALPYLAILMGALAAARLRTGIALMALLIAGGAGGVLRYHLRIGGGAPGVDAGADLNPLYQRFADTPDLGVIVRPAHSMGDAAYRLATLPGVDQGACPVTLCSPPGPRRVYGASGELTALAELRARHARVLLIDYQEFAAPEGCRAIHEVRGVRAYDCSKPTD